MKHTPVRFSAFTLTLAALLGGCATAPGGQDASVQVCEDPRPQVCTMDYRPVCATHADGSSKTFGNGCSACGDASVVSWVEGECPE